ncbi:protein NCBP2AS2-like [Mercenaria mercenaria]|uniref:protein NCBP2AS2-like n=1 Tax=Mercenaria mercenaria TaxID=6596 RepID=UPI00234F68C5|nr:protein NCBP2AS2-like [Mercenaria mercenaria]
MFTHNEQLIQKLSETGPIRYAARMTVYWFLQAKQKGFDKLSRPGPNSPSDTTTSIKSFSDRFKNELNKGFQDLENQRRNKH